MSGKIIVIMELEPYLAYGIIKAKSFYRKCVNNIIEKGLLYSLICEVPKKRQIQ